MCGPASSQQEVRAAIAEIESRLDPCGGSVEVADLLERFRRCGGGSYRICIDRDSERNSIDQSGSEAGDSEGGVAVSRSVITWNPALRTQLEVGCGGDPKRPVLRDPTASLLHELVHAVQDCEGLDPAEHELEAVRVENIYRRARGLCQRTAYGNEPLPPSMTISCEPGKCLCRSGADSPSDALQVKATGAPAGAETAGESPALATAGDAAGRSAATGE